jgi:SAM-dependent MidA family methyltransferase
MGATVHGPIEQAQFLRRLGIEKRATALKATAREKALDVDAAVARLTGEARTSMGRMFKVVAFGAPTLGVLPGFEG